MPRPRKLWTTTDPEEAVAKAEAFLAACPVLGGKPCVVFDVDETLLRNHPKNETTRVNLPGKALYDAAAARGLDMYIVTARKKSKWARGYLEAQLRAHGYDPAKFSKMYMLPREYRNNMSASRFKLHARRRITQKHGGRILLNVGDQVSDMFLAGPYARANDSMGATLSGGAFYGLAPGDGCAVVALKFPHHYHVA